MQFTFIPEFLKTLPKRELFSGAGEIFKYSFLADKKNYNMLKNNLAKLFSGNKINFNRINNILFNDKIKYCNAG